MCWIELGLFERNETGLKIIIVGDGKVGFALAEHLSQEEHDVTVIDTNDDALRRASEALDVLCVKGNGASLSALREAEAGSADVVIAATSMDEINMVCSLAAKRLGAKYTIARVRNVEYAKELSLLKDALGIDLVINPENAAAVEISRLLRFPPASNLETFCRGRVELISFRVREEDFLVGKPLSAQSSQIQELPMLFCAVEREGEDVVIPDGSFVPRVGDRLYLIGQPTGLTAFFRLLGRHTPRSRNVFLVGGGRIAYYLAAILDRLGMRVKIVERSEERCRVLSEALPHATILCGDGTDQQLLEEENVAAADAFVALTDRDEDNLIISLYAMQQGIAKVVAKSNRQNYAGIAHQADHRRPDPPGGARHAELQGQRDERPVQDRRRPCRGHGVRGQRHHPPPGGAPEGPGPEEGHPDRRSGPPGPHHHPRRLRGDLRGGHGDHRLQQPRHPGHQRHL